VSKVRVFSENEADGEYEISESEADGEYEITLLLLLTWFFLQQLKWQQHAVQVKCTHQL
jgi:hypothetical protein